jgi:hypothetical protein
MTQQKERNPAGGPGFGYSELQRDCEIKLQGDITTPALRSAAARVFQYELSIVLMAAHRVASLHGLSWDDYDRVHLAHQRILPLLAALKGHEVFL